VGNAEYHAGEGWTMGALGDILGPERVDGLLLLGDVLPLTLNHEGMAAFVQEHRHVVTVGCRPILAGEIAISVDNTRGVTLALDYLFALGHRSIAYIGPDQWPMSWEDEQRWEAHARFMEAHGLPYGPAYSADVRGHDLAVARKALQRVLAAPARPTAAFVSNDMSALLLLKAALTYGLRVPDDLSLVGFDGIQSAELSTPGLTTVRQPIEAIGRYAADALLDKIAAIAPPPLPLEGASGINRWSFCRPWCAVNRRAHPHCKPHPLAQSAAGHELTRKTACDYRGDEERRRHGIGDGLAVASAWWFRPARLWPRASSKTCLEKMDL